MASDFFDARMNWITGCVLMFGAAQISNLVML